MFGRPSFSQRAVFLLTRGVNGSRSNRGKQRFNCLWLSVVYSTYFRPSTFRQRFVNYLSKFCQWLVMKYSWNTPRISINRIALYLARSDASIKTHFIIRTNLWKKNAIHYWLSTWNVNPRSITTKSANMLQTTIGIVSTPPVDLTEDTNRDTKKTHKEKPTLLKAG